MPLTPLKALVLRPSVPREVCGGGPNRVTAARIGASSQSPPCPVASDHFHTRLRTSRRNSCTMNHDGSSTLYCPTAVRRISSSRACGCPGVRLFLGQEGPGFPIDRCPAKLGQRCPRDVGGSPNCRSLTDRRAIGPGRFLNMFLFLGGTPLRRQLGLRGLGEFLRNNKENREQRNRKGSS